MIHRSWLLGLGLLAAAVTLLTGCKQKEGDPCQTSSDCKGSLICCFDTVSGKGTCQYSCIGPDGGPPEAGPPEAGPPEAGLPEAGPPEAGPPEAGPPDAGPPEAGLPEASVEDATVDASPSVDASP